MSRIDDAVRRILRVKFEMGLFDMKLPESMSETGRDRALQTPSSSVVRSPEHLALAREAVAKSLVILKNNDVIPLTENQWQGKKLYVAGFAADDIGVQCGGWTISWQGASGSITRGTTILKGLQEALPSVNMLYSASAEFDAIDPGSLCVVVVGEKPYAEGKGDSADISLAPRDLEAITKARQQFRKVMLVLVSGRPLILNESALSCDAIVATWLPGTEGAGVADVLTGKAPSTGRLPCDWPASTHELPLDNFIQGKEKPLFPRGYGL